MKPAKTLAIVALVSILGLTACDSRPAPTSVLPTPISIIPTTTSQPTPTWMLTVTLGPIPTDTPTVTPTAEPTATLCPAPTPGGPVSQIVFSAVPCTAGPDGCELHELSVANLYLINSDGTGLRQLIEGGNLLGGLSLSPDGEKIVFTDAREDVQFSPFRSHIYVWNISTGEIQPLMANLSNESSPQPAQWFLDSSRVAYVSNVVDDRGTRLRDSQTDLYTIRADGTGRTKVTNRSPNSHIQSVAISPDGLRITFVSREFDAPEQVTVSCVNTDGSNPRELMALPLPAYQTGLFWSPDGNRIVAFDPTRGRPTELYIVESDSTDEETRRIAQIPGYLMGWRWSSNSEVEIATCERDIGIFVWVLHVDSGDLVELTSAPRRWCGSAYEWSFDGTQIAFADDDPSSSPERYGLYVLDAINGCEHQILEKHVILDLLWLPSGITIP